MTDQHPSALEPFGRALLAYWRGDTSTRLCHEYASGRTESVPVSVFFRGAADFYPTEQALAYCRGRILVVGAGTGVHALELERRGFDVTALEVTPQAVQIMTERGLNDVRQGDFFAFSGEAYDTVLMLGHNIGICETVGGLKTLLDKCRSLLRGGGQVLANSVDESVSERAAAQGGYPGELRFRLSHAGITGRWMRWLHVDFDTLSRQARACGWSAEKLVGTPEGGFLARLGPCQNSMIHILYDQPRAL